MMRRQIYFFVYQDGLTFSRARKLHSHRENLEADFGCPFEGFERQLCHAIQSARPSGLVGQ